jgi:hypothetical protein
MPPKVTKRGRKTAKRELASSKLQSLVKKAIAANNNKMLETKHSISSNSDGTELGHNNILVRNSSLLATGQGTADPVSGTTQNRIGDKITLTGLSVKCMFELNERYSMATFRIFIVKSAKGDTPTSTTLWNNISNNKMIDSFNKERFTILTSKTFTIKQSSTGMDADGIQTIGGGFAEGIPTISRATRIVKLWVSANKLVKGKTLTYESGTSQPKFYDYHLIYYSYSNYSTTSTLGAFNVGRINDEVIQLYYKDA